MTEAQANVGHFEEMQSAPRFPIHLSASVKSQGGAFSAETENISANGAPPRLVRQLLEARLQSELGRGSQPGITESEIARDWKLLEQTLPESDEPLTARSGQRAENNIRSNRP